MSKEGCHLNIVYCENCPQKGQNTCPLKNNNATTEKTAEAQEQTGQPVRGCRVLTIDGKECHRAPTLDL